ncbi:hypothetical protein [Ferrimonas marina]|nr:hypothetical protein [Ferrimonas marina]
MTRLTILLSALLLVTSAHAGHHKNEGVPAGNEAHPAHAGHAQGHHKMLSDYLELDEQQQAAFAAEHERYRTQRQEIKSSGDNPDAKVAEMEAADARHQKEMKAILSDEQYAKYQEFRKAHHGKGKGHGKGHGKKSEGSSY